MSVSEEAFKAAAHYVLRLHTLGYFGGSISHNALLLRSLISEHLPDAALDVLTAPYHGTQYAGVADGINFVVLRASITLPGATWGRRKHSLRRSYRRYCQRKGWEVPDWLLGPKQRKAQYQRVNLALSRDAAGAPYVACALP